MAEQPQLESDPKQLSKWLEFLQNLPTSLGFKENEARQQIRSQLIAAIQSGDEAEIQRLSAEYAEADDQGTESFECGMDVQSALIHLAAENLEGFYYYLEEIVWPRIHHLDFPEDDKTLDRLSWILDQPPEDLFPSLLD